MQGPYHDRDHARTPLHGTKPQENLGTSAITEAGAEAWFTETFERLSQFHGWDGVAGTMAGELEGCSLFGFGGANIPCAPGHGSGAAWSFVRYLSDRFGTEYLAGEHDFHRTLIDLEPTGNPLDVLEQLTGTALADLGGDWFTMLYVDGRLTAAEAPSPGMRISFPRAEEAESRNLRLPCPRTHRNRGRRRDRILPRHLYRRARPDRAQGPKRGRRCGAARVRPPALGVRVR